MKDFGLLAGFLVLAIVENTKATKWGKPPAEPFLGIDGDQLLALSGKGREQRLGDGTKKFGTKIKPPEAKWVTLPDKITCSTPIKNYEEQMKKTPMGFYINTRKTGIKHTMCDPKYNPKKGTKVPERGIHLDDVKHILKTMNKLRAFPFPKGNGFGVKVFGERMQRLYWDPNLAMVAQRLTDSCVAESDLFRNLPGEKGYLLQNTCFGTESFDHCIHGWYETYKIGDWDLTMNEEKRKRKKLQPWAWLAMDTTNRVGCGYTWCGEKKHFVCNFNPGTLKWSWYPHIFRKLFPNGEKCGKCKKCVDDLCDCKGKQCSGGTLDTKTCKCKCPKNYHRGPTCDILECPVEELKDPATCGKSGQLKKHYCDVPIVRDTCPRMCQLCETFIETPPVTLISQEGEKVPYVGGSKKNLKPKTPLPIVKIKRKDYNKAKKEALAKANATGSSLGKLVLPNKIVKKAVEKALEKRGKIHSKELAKDLIKKGTPASQKTASAKFIPISKLGTPASQKTASAKFIPISKLRTPASQKTASAKVPPKKKGGTPSQKPASAKAPPKKKG